MKQKKNVTRRQFLKTSAAFSGVLILPKNILAQGQSPNSRPNVALIGTGQAGAVGFKSLMARHESGDINLVALCDVDRRGLANAMKRKLWTWDKNPSFDPDPEYGPQAAFEKHPDAVHFSDYREMFDTMADKIDVVYIVTPDHNHFDPTLRAIRLGKAVATQKPLCNIIAQCRTITRALKEHRVPTLMGNQGYIAEGPRLLKEWYDAGLLGELVEVHAWTINKTSVPLVNDYPPGEPVPDGFGWNLWLGPSPGDLPYHHYYCPGQWRFWTRFGNGWVGDWAVHAFGPIWYAFEPGWPERIEVWRETPSPLQFTGKARLTYHIPSNGRIPAFRLHWYEGGPDNVPPLPPGVTVDFANSPCGAGLLVVGTKACVLADGWGGNMRIVPEEKFEELKPHLPPKTLQRRFTRLEDALKQGSFDTGSPFEVAAELTNFCLLGKIALQVNRNLDFDRAAFRFKNDPEANALMAGPYQARAGYSPWSMEG